MNFCSCQLTCTTAIALNGNTSLQVTIPARTYNNGECVGVRFAQAIPSNGTPLPVNIVMGATSYPLLKPCGNRVMSDQLRSGRLYCLRVLGNPAHFTVKNCNSLCRTAYVVPQINPAPVVAASAEAE